MAREKPAALQIETFADHHVITQPNPLRKVLRRVADDDLDDPVARAEKALAGLSGEFNQWMEIEVGRLVAAHAAIVGPATSYAMGQGATMISAAWGVFVWREFAHAPPRAKRLLAPMFVLFIFGLTAVAVAPLFVKA